MILSSLSSVDQLRFFPRNDRLARWVPENPFVQRPDRHLVVAGEGRHIEACCSLWWRETPDCEGLATGAIGHFFARDRESADLLLGGAVRELKGAGAKLAIGPMDGSTWRRYRFITKRGDEPVFFMEPDNPPEWPGWFEAAGFRPLARYTSNLFEGAPGRDERLARTRERMENAGVRIRNVDLSDFEEELKRIYAISRIAFRENFLYTPLPENLFLEQYREIQPLVHPALVLLAEDEDGAAGFAFATPDLLEKRAGREQRTAILKTLAVLPGRKYAGLGALLAGLVREEAAAIGLPRMIHALMHEKNSSRNLAKEGVKVIREYTLYAQNL